MGIFTLEHHPSQLPSGHAVRITLPTTMSDAAAAFQQGRKEATAYKGEGGYALLECAPSEDVDSFLRLATALGYSDERPDATLLGKGVYDKLAVTAELNALFSAGFAVEVSRRHPVVLKGGLEMAGALLIADKIAGRDGLPMDPRKITFLTTRQFIQRHGDLLDAVFACMDFRPRVLYSDEAAGEER